MPKRSNGRFQVQWDHSKSHDAHPKPPPTGKVACGAQQIHEFLIWFADGIRPIDEMCLRWPGCQSIRRSQRNSLNTTQARRRSNTAWTLISPQNKISPHRHGLCGQLCAATATVINGTPPPLRRSSRHQSWNYERRFIQRSIVNSNDKLALYRRPPPTWKVERFGPALIGKLAQQQTDHSRTRSPSEPRLNSVNQPVQLSQLGSGH